MIDHAPLDALAFVTDELTARGGLVEVDGDRALVILPGPVAGRLELAESMVLAVHPAEGAVACGLGSPLLDRLITDVRASIPLASIAWGAEAPRLASAERLAERWFVRNGVASVLGVTHASATYLAGVFAWTAEADDRYEGLVLAVAHGTTASEPDEPVTAAIARMIGGDDAGTLEARGTSGAVDATGVVARRAALAIGPRLDEVTAAVVRRRDRERGRIDEYFGALITEAKRPRRQIARAAIGARVAALEAERAAKHRDLDARYTLRLRLEPVALVAVSMRVAEVRVRLRRRKGERELALHVPPGARAPDALACVACAATTSAPLLCDDALHILCERCAPDPNGRPRCPACRGGRGASSS